MGPPLPQNLTATLPSAAIAMPADLAFGSEPYVCEILEPHAIFDMEGEIRLLEALTLEPNTLGGADFMIAACRHFPERATPSFLAVRKRQPGRSGALMALFALRPGGLEKAHAVLRSWDHMFSVCGVPLINRHEPVAILTSVLSHLAHAGERHAALCLAQIDSQGPFAAALAEACANAQLPLDFLSPYTRAALTVPTPEPVWNRNRRKQRRRLASAGLTAFRVAETYADIRAALERFLALEAGGWKGAAGTALLSDPQHTNFARALVWSSALSRNVRIAELTLNDTAIASVIVFSSGGRGLAWKIAHDQAFARYSPGALLMLELTDWLSTSSTIAMVDSCADEGNTLVEPIWHDRLAIADAMISLRPASSARYRSTLMRERFRRSLRARAKIIYNRLRRAAPETGS